MTPDTEKDAAADERLAWAEKHLAPIFRSELDTFEGKLVKSFRVVLESSIGALSKRQDALEKRQDKVEGVQRRTIGWSVSLSLFATAVLVFVGKWNGWWL